MIFTIFQYSDGLYAYKGETPDDINFQMRHFGWKYLVLMMEDHEFQQFPTIESREFNFGLSEPPISVPRNWTLA